MTGGGSLGSAAAVRSDDFEQVWFVAAELDGAGMEGSGEGGVRATNSDPSSSTNSGLIFAIDGYATEFSDLGDAASIDAEMSITDDGASEAQDCVSPSTGLSTACFPTAVKVPPNTRSPRRTDPPLHRRLRHVRGSTSSDLPPHLVMNYQSAKLGIASSASQASVCLVLPILLQHLPRDRERMGLSEGHMGWLLGISRREYRELEAGTLHITNDLYERIVDLCGWPR